MFSTGFIKSLHVDSFIQKGFLDGSCSVGEGGGGGGGVYSKKIRITKVLCNLSIKQASGYIFGGISYISSNCMVFFTFNQYWLEGKIYKMVSSDIHVNLVLCLHRVGHKTAQL